MTTLASHRSGWRATVVHPAIGAEVHDLDLRRQLDADETALLRQLFDDHGLLLFRDQQLDEADQIRICAHLRPVVDPVAWVSNVEPGFHPEGELLWHCDYAFTPHPMLGLSLYAIELGDGAAPTSFANNARAWTHLDDDLHRRLESARIVHCIDAVGGRDNLRTRLDDVGGEAASHEAYPRFARPAIFDHPVTGRPLLFVLEQQASHVEGMSCAASDELIDAAFEVLYDPSNVYLHDWKVGDLVVWDNLTLQHGRPANPNTIRRSLRRVAMNTVTTSALVRGTGFERTVRERLAALAARDADPVTG